MQVKTRLPLREPKPETDALPGSSRAAQDKEDNYCFAIARNVLGNPEDAGECVNDTWLAAWNAMPEERPSSLSAFLGKLTRRISIDRWRRKQAVRRGGGETPLVLDELAECVPAAESVQAHLEAEELSRAVNAFVKALPQAEMGVFLCRYWYLDPVADICRRFGFSQSKVKSMLARTRKRLHAYLEKEGLL